MGLKFHTPPGTTQGLINHKSVTTGDDSHERDAWLREDNAKEGKDPVEGLDPKVDLVVMDDFIYGEPQMIP